MRKKDITFLIALVSIIVIVLQEYKLLPPFSKSSPAPTTTISPLPSVVEPTAVLGDATDVSASVSAQVIRVVDGDTVKVTINNQEQTIRLIGINTPETVDPRREVQCFGKEASDKAKEVLNGQTVYIESDPSQGTVDKYDRLLGYIWLTDGTSFNKYMISEGYAYEYTYDLPYKYQSDFKRAQLESQESKKGLWSDTTCEGKIE